MKLTPAELNLVKEGWFAIENPEQVVELFYIRLFEMHPEVILLFKESKAVQVKKITGMMEYMLRKTEVIHDLADEVKLMAKRHVRYGTSPAHYQAMRDILLNTLATAWVEEKRQVYLPAWEKWYDFLSETMIESAYQ